MSSSETNIDADALLVDCGYDVATLGDRDARQAEIERLDTKLSLLANSVPDWRVGEVEALKAALEGIGRETETDLGATLAQFDEATLASRESLTDAIDTREAKLAGLRDSLPDWRVDEDEAEDVVYALVGADP